MKIFTPEGMEPDAGAVAQIERCMQDERAVHGALMADHHLGYSMPIGGVVAYDGAISPSGVGFDIGCGNMAVRTDMRVPQVMPNLKSTMREVQRTVAFGLGRSNDVPVEHELFEEHAAVLQALEVRVPGLTAKARKQLGTIGSGNHYVDLLADEDDHVWVANHFGSRGLGHTIAKGFLNLADGRRFDDSARDKEEPTVLPTDTYLGDFYLSAMKLAGDYARAGREYVIEQVLDILGTWTQISVHNHHNYAWLEDGLWVVRKGATPLTTDLAYIGGSMGDGAVIVRGKWRGLVPGGVIDVGALGSAPHGAGRVMSRTKAAGKFKRVRDERTGKRVKVRASDGVVDWRAVRADLTERGIVVLGSGADEAPEVYKPLDDVIAAHPNVEVVYRLRPLGVVMAGNEFDPYKE